MKLPLSWLREWVAIPWSAHELGERLTMLGFEVEGLSAAAPPFSGVIVAEILGVEPHPKGEKLRICRVDVGQDAALQIVCGAANARAGLRTALAVVGATLPDGTGIRQASLRGVDSFGMLCSAKELGLPESQPGILELAADVPIGTDLRAALDLDEQILEVSVTPNRGDGMSVLGIAREIAALTAQPLRGPQWQASAAIGPGGPGVRIEPDCQAGRFSSRVIRGVDNARPSPQWLQQRLQRAGLRPVSPIVDVTNLVMLELGQPMHAYDATLLRGDFGVRSARAGERIDLLFRDEPVALSGGELLIVDAEGPIGLAGVMGGKRTSISSVTSDVVLESAWFAPAAIAGRARNMGLVSEASQRFERGTDPDGITRALERATTLIIEIAGGVAGPLVAAENASALPPRREIMLRAAQVHRLLGTKIEATRIAGALRALGMELADTEGGWRVVPPSWRFDITIEADLIEEVARFVGLDAIPEMPAQTTHVLRALPETRAEEPAMLQLLAARGYQETISYGFTDPVLQTQLFGIQPAVELANPIAAQSSVMRASLWPGLITVLRTNLNRQADRTKLFEIGTRFLLDAASQVEEQWVIAGLACGARWPEQWSAGRDEIDYHDVKGDVTALLQYLGAGADVGFEPLENAVCLHPGRSAQLVQAQRVIGLLGELHPVLVRELGLTYRPVLFELNLDALIPGALPQFREFSPYPATRRDLSFTVPDSVSFGQIRDRVSVAASSSLRELRIFDIYQGSNVESGRKSVALGLILQDLSRTLTDADADRIVAVVMGDLTRYVDARIRD